MNSPDAAVLLAAGRGTRLAEATGDKILHPIRGRPVFAYTLEAFAATETVTEIVIVYRDGNQRAELETAVTAVPGITPERLHWTAGGKERQDSVYRGLQCLPAATQTVFIHDCARPLVRPEQLAELGRLAREDGAACLAHRIAETVKQTESGAGSTRRLRLKDLDRERLWATETPQAFEYGLVLRAYEKARQAGFSITDDAAAVSLSGCPVSLLENPHPNPKLTRPRDLAYIRFLLREK